MLKAAERTRRSARHSLEFVWVTSQEVVQPELREQLRELVDSTSTEVANRIDVLLREVRDGQG